MISNKKQAIRKCEELSRLCLDLAVQFRYLAKSIEQHGLDHRTTEFIDKEIKRFKGEV